MTKDSAQSQLFLNDFQRKLAHDSRQLDVFSRSLSDFLNAQTTVETVDAMSVLLKNQLESYEQTTPLFHFSESFWLSQMLVKLFNLKGSTFFSTLNSENELLGSLRADALPNFEFYFVKAQIPVGGFYLRETSLQNNLFYLDIFNRRFFIDASDFVQLIASQVGRRLTDQQIANLSSAFNQLAEILSEDQFALDLNLIQPENDAVLEIDKVDLPAIVTDKLFILAQAHHTDIVALDNGFEISFNEDLKLYLTQRLDPIGHSQWSFKVVDLYDQWSLMAVLAKYDWFLNWYLDDLAKLQIAYRREFFAG
ncbi:hypothetical protein [Oenococcus sicerae]|uniref:Uncharacterized protein n=1 Tax=Oenococcus sicerae TaxID=2203724 RepID=A0AAJ1VN02_9LACO|nr:hypothetical protein [Oenococcus sicerae]MDN6899704.1 hypothetical protein [Oenococcus sicerae]